MAGLPTLQEFKARFTSGEFAAAVVSVVVVEGFYQQDAAARSLPVVLSFRVAVFSLFGP